MVDMTEQRLALLEANMKVADKQREQLHTDLRELTNSVNLMAHTLAQINARIEAFPRIQENIRAAHERDVIEDALAAHRARAQTNARSVVTVAIAMSSFMAALVFGVLDFLTRV